MKNKYFYILIVSFIINISLLLILFDICVYKTDYAHRIYSKYTGHVYVPKRCDDDCVKSWNNCLIQMKYNADVVFFGNSITANHDWQSKFPDKRIVNLGYIGEDIKGMIRRVDAVAAVSPQKVFVMAGINGLKDQNLEDFEILYCSLVDSLLGSLPDASVYLQSILPITQGSNYCSNEKIRDANQLIALIAKNRSLKYIDLYCLYADNGALPDYMSYDGLHLKSGMYKDWLDCIKPFIE